MSAGKKQAGRSNGQTGFWRRAVRLPLLGRFSPERPTVEDLEELLIEADFGVRAADRLIARLDRGKGDRRAELRRATDSILASAGPVALAASTSAPTVYLMVGVNGTGKTTSTAKVAHHLRSAGKSVLVAAADTFRAGAVKQLALWAERSGAEFLRGKEGGDPAAVAFDAVSAAISRGIDVAIIDTAGRLHTNASLMSELGKIERVVARRLPGAPHETLIVLDATTGQNALSQLEGFASTLPVTGIVLTRLDSSAKGGIVVALAEEHRVPVKLVGTGEQLGDLARFDRESFLDGVFGA